MQSQNQNQQAQSLNKSTYQKIGPFHIIKLRGTIYERAYAHGSFLSSQIVQGPMADLSDFNQKLIDHAYLGPGLNWLKPIAKFLYQHLLIKDLRYHQLLLFPKSFGTFPHL